MGLKQIIKTIKKDYWALQQKQFRYELLNYFLADIPGESGRILRRWLYKKYSGAQGKQCIFFPGIKVRNIERLFVGDYVGMGEDCFLQAGGGIEIRNNTLLGPRAMVWSVNHNFSDPDLLINKQGTVGDKVVIGSDCWLGANVFIMPGVNLGDGCVVSAGAVVGRKNYPPYSILAGNPAKRIGSRQ